MSNRVRLLKLESHKAKIVYPSFSDMYDLQTTESYNQWLLDNNKGLTLDRLNSLNIRHLESMYE